MNGTGKMLRRLSAAQNAKMKFNQLLKPTNLTFKINEIKEIEEEVPEEEKEFNNGEF